MSSFIIYFTFSKFFHSMRKGATVYIAGYSRTEINAYRCILLLTSDAGMDGGTVRAVQLHLTEVYEEDEKAKKGLTKAFGLLETFLTSKDLQVQEGALLTTGLNEALDTWATVPKVSIPQLRGLLASGKKAVLEQ